MSSLNDRKTRVTILRDVCSTGQEIREAIEKESGDKEITLFI